MSVDPKLLENLPGKLAVQITMMQLMVLQLDGHKIANETWILYFDASVTGGGAVNKFLKHAVEKYFQEAGP